MNAFRMLEEDIFEQEVRRDGPQVAAAKLFRKAIDPNPHLTTPRKEYLYRRVLEEIWAKNYDAQQSLAFVRRLLA